MSSTLLLFLFLFSLIFAGGIKRAQLSVQMHVNWNAFTFSCRNPLLNDTNTHSHLQNTLHATYNTHISPSSPPYFLNWWLAAPGLRRDPIQSSITLFSRTHSVFPLRVSRSRGAEKPPQKEGETGLAAGVEVSGVAACCCCRRFFSRSCKNCLVDLSC